MSFASGSLKLDQDNIALRLLDLTKATGYEIVQKHGQRIYGGPPPGWIGPVPDKGTEVYCYRIPRDCFEDELVPVFSMAGTIYELRLMIEFSGTNRSYCYVRYTKQSEAREAIKKLNRYCIRPGFPLAVTRSVDNRKLSLKTVPSNITESEERICTELQEFVDGVSKVSKLPKGKIEVEFESHRLAALARRKLVPGNALILGRIQFKQVDWADPEDMEEESRSKILAIVSPPPQISIQSIGDLFNEISSGNVVDILESKNNVLVMFSSEENARKALREIQDVTVEGHILQVKPWRQKQMDNGNYSSVPRHFQHKPQFPFNEFHDMCARLGFGVPQYRMSYGHRDNSGINFVFKCMVYVPGVPIYDLCGNWSENMEVAKSSAAFLAMQRIFHAYTGTPYPNTPSSSYVGDSTGFGLSNYNSNGCSNYEVPPMLEQALKSLSIGNSSVTQAPEKSSYTSTVESSSFGDGSYGNYEKIITRPSSVILSKPNSPKPVLAVPPAVHKRC